MVEIGELAKERALKPAFDKAKALGAADLYSDKEAENFFSGKTKVCFVAEVLFNNETLAEKQARLLSYDVDFLNRLKEQDIDEMNFTSLKQKIEYIESCRALENSCKKTMALFKKRHREAIILEEAAEMGKITTHFIVRPVYDEEGKEYKGAVDFIAFYCHSGYEEEMINVVKSQEEEWLDKSLDRIMKAKSSSAKVDLEIEKLVF